LDRTEIYLRKYEKKNKEQSLETIIALINKMELQKENNRLFSKRKEAKKGKFSLSNIIILIKCFKNH
jgi:hypothetical protein